MKTPAHRLRALIKALLRGHSPKQAATLEAERERLDRIRNPKDWEGK
jgi:hypothetical protein